MGQARPAKETNPTDRPRLLHKDSSHGYTHHRWQALPDEPEAISAEDQAAISTQARASFASERATENERRDRQVWQQRLRRAEMAATSKGVDVMREQTAIRQQILHMERRVAEAR